MRIPPLTITWISKWQRLQSVCYIVTNWINQVVCAYLVFVWIGLIWCLWFALRFAPFFFFHAFQRHICTVAEIFYFSEHQWIPCTVHRTHKLHFSSTFSLKMGLTALCMYLKIILLQCFQFQKNKFYPNGPLERHKRFFIGEKGGGGGENSRSKDFKTNINAVLAELLKLSYK